MGRNLGVEFPHDAERDGTWSISMNEPLKKRSGGIPTETYSWVAAAGRREGAEGGAGERRRREEQLQERTGKHGFEL